MQNYNLLDENELEFVTIATVDEIPNGERMQLEIDDISLVVFNIGGKYFAIGDQCSHDKGPLGNGELEDNVIVCPRHGARFDVSDGMIQNYPAYEDIPAYPVRVVEGEILVGLPITK